MKIRPYAIVACLAALPVMGDGDRTPAAPQAAVAPARLDTRAAPVVLQAPQIFGLPQLPDGHSYVRLGGAVVEVVDATGVILRRVGPLTGLEN